jgi:dihydroorotate dehydrogenase electron transfer subunit
MIDEEVCLLSNERVAEDMYLARLEAPAIAARVAPGQFVNLRVSQYWSPFLRLPLSACAADPKSGTLEVLYEDMGPKSRALSRLRPGERTQCLGPLGKGFWAPERGQRAVLVGGGIGLPPLLFWGRTLRRRGWEVVLLAGARRAGKHLPQALLEGAAAPVRRATDDGSLGHHGLVTELLKEELEKGAKSAVYTCGPHAMMRAVARLCQERQVPCQAALEEYMACGIGICVGCVVRVKTAEGESPYAQYRRICVDGPVLDASRVCWEG